MLTVEQVKYNISNYKIENGIVIDKSNNQPVQDENKILEVKSSVMMYREAKSLYDKRLRGAPEDHDYYIKTCLTCQENLSSVISKLLTLAETNIKINMQSFDHTASGGILWLSEL